jgi:hypothetical protein
VATLGVLDAFQNDSRFNLLRNETQDNARTAIDRVARELRNVSAPSVKEAGALEQAKRFSLTFQTINSTPPQKGELESNVTDAMRVRYCLNDTNPSNEVLWRETMHWKTELPPPLPTSTACPDLNIFDWEHAEELVTHITNRIQEPRSLFVYGPPGASLTSQITSVEPTIYSDLNPGGQPGERRITTTIYLRNQNRTPVASFTATELGPHRVYLNASESADPNGLALSYRWWDNGSLLNTTSQQYETQPLPENSTQTFKLEVQNPGGLSSVAEQVFQVK